MNHIISLFKGLVLIGLFGVFSSYFIQAGAEEKYASIVIDADTKEILHARFADAERYPASLTKVMTLYMLFDAIKAGDIKLDDRLTVSRQADRQPASDLGVKAGSKIKVEDAIRALITKSANDVAVVVAERIGGTEERFAALMTVKARLLGLENTTFFNASGLPDDRQITTARDMAKLSIALLEHHADYYHYFSSTQFTWGRNVYRNHNKLVGKVTGVDGIKTGYTRASGYNLIASAKRSNRRIIAVMLGGKTSKARNAHVTDLIEAAYTALEKRPDQLLQASTVDTGIAFETTTPATHTDALSVSGVTAINRKRAQIEPLAQGSADEDSPLEYSDQ